MMQLLPLDRIHRRAGARAGIVPAMGEVDRSRPFLSERLTPVYYTPGYATLTEPEKLRYNQITAMHFNELIAFFETTFSGVLEAVLESRAFSLPAELREAVVQFAEDERRHTQMFRDLNLASEPAWYARGPHHLVQASKAGVWILSRVARRPDLFPAVLWVMLVMEEKALAMARDVLREQESLEPHYVAVHRAHLEDEVRHVQVDWHLLERLYPGRPRGVRELNARFFGFLVGRYFLAPDRAARAVLGALVREQPGLAPRARQLSRELRNLAQDKDYQRMMYSRETCPIAFALFDRFPEFRVLKRTFLAYGGAP